MQSRDTFSLVLMEGWFDDDRTVHFHANFALHGGNGATDSSVVVIALQPGEKLGEHTDSPEEILLVIDGNVEFQVGSERGRAGRGTLAVVPAMVPHSISNVGDTPARIIGFFPSPAVVATFVEPVMPLGQSVLTFGDASAGALAGQAR